MREFSSRCDESPCYIYYWIQDLRSLSAIQFKCTRERNRRPVSLFYSIAPTIISCWSSVGIGTNGAEQAVRFPILLYRVQRAIVPIIVSCYSPVSIDISGDSSKHSCMKGVDARKSNQHLHSYVNCAVHIISSMYLFTIILCVLLDD